MSDFWQQAYAAWGDTTTVATLPTGKAPGAGRRRSPQSVRARAILLEVGPEHSSYQALLPRLIAEDAVVSSSWWAHLRAELFGVNCVNLSKGERRPKPGGGWERI